ncbi:MAG: hypothetical protein U0667_02260 [Chloroflexota bacterium]
MRLPWPFRRQPSDGAAAPAAVGVVQRVEAPVRHDWRVAGTLLPTFAGDPGIRIQRFPDEVAGRQLPTPILAPLGHARTVDGPAGLVSGLARPTLAPTTAAPGSRVDLPLRSRRPTAPAQRMTEGGGMSDGGPVPSGLAPSAAVPISDGDSAAPAPAHDLLPPLEPRQASVVAAPTPRPGPLTVARTPDPALAAGLSLAPSRGTAAAADPSARRIPGTAGETRAREAQGAPAVPGTPAGAPTRTILRTPGGSRVRLGPPVERSTLSPGSPSVDLALPARPAPTAPPAGTLQRHPAAHAPQAHPATPETPLTGGLAATIEEEPLVGSRPPAPAPGIPGGLVLARVVAASRPDDDGVAPDQPPPSSLGVMAPLVGVEAIGPSAPLRPTLPGRAPASPSTDAGQAAPGPARRPTMQRATAGGAAERGTSRPGAAQRLGTIPVARAVADGAAGWLDSPAGGVTRLTTAVAARGSADGRDASMGAAGDLRVARSATSVVASANDPRRPGARPSVATDAPALAVAQRASSVVAQRASTDALPAAPDDPTPSEDTSAPPTASAGPTATTAQPASPAGGATTIADRDLDEMVRRLYPRLRRSLSSELLVARERAGTLADVR